jgi:2-hydroxy-3-keto-5-methylthiopentenyl-1-phosphate phosphatase
VSEPPRKVLVSDFDGTMTRNDFYQLVAARLLPPGTPDYWAEYRSGRITHFEALRSYFLAARPGEHALVDLYHDMKLDPDLRAGLLMLRDAGWSVVVASAGCLWYIDRLLREAGARDLLEVHANRGHIAGGRLVMELPHGSPFFSAEVGIDKPAIVRHALATADEVAFAGDGPPDVAPALLVKPGLRFATGFLAGALAERGAEFHPFQSWIEVARVLAASVSST